MIYTLLSHQWKSFWRSRSAGKNIAVRLFMGFITIYLLFSALALGIFLEKFIARIFPGQQVINSFCGLILYYFSFDIIVRFMMQELPTLTIQPYLIQNIRRSQLIRFLNLRSIFVIFNLIPVLLFVPFTINVIVPQYGTAASLGFIITIIGLTLFNHFIILYVKRKSIINSWWLVTFFIVIAAFIACDYFKLFSLSNASAIVFIKMLTDPWLCFAAVAMAVFAFINNYRFLLQNLYLEDIVAKGKRKEGTEYVFLNRFGTIGELIAVDLKMITRNKRPRFLLISSAIILFYGFIFYKPQNIQGEGLGMLLFGGLFLTGIFISNYGQFLFAWQSSHFDGMMAGNLNIKTYIKSKFILFTAVSTLVLLLSSLYGLISWKILVIQFVGFLFNAGIHTVIVVYFATRSYKGIDITKKGAYNIQGTGASQLIYSLIIFLVPAAIYLPFALLVTPWTGIIVLGVLGLISFLLQDWWIELLTKEFIKRKHRILEGFREK